MAKSARPGARSGVSLDAVADAALEGFVEGGYRLTQVADVAARLGLSVGALYRYVDGKETLFLAAALHAARILQPPDQLPLTAAALRGADQALRTVIAAEARWPALDRAAAAPGAGPDQIAAVGAELFDLLSRWAALIRLLERCGRDRPDVAELFETEMRGRYMADLCAWAERFQRPGAGLADAAVLARGAMEAVSWLALRRPRDSSGRGIPDGEARLAAIELFAGAFLSRI